MLGAGVSVSAGMPAFRGTGGIHTQKFNGESIEDLMHINAMAVCPLYS
jgi:NAD-dependent SIR2 family protein deacetylase